jgi:hypothetical protein
MQVPAWVCRDASSPQLPPIRFQKAGQDTDMESQAITAFNNSKEMLAKATLLHLSRPEALTNITTDASDTAVGAVLQQHIDGAWFTSLRRFNRQRPGITPLTVSYWQYTCPSNTSGTLSKACNFISLLTTNH